MSNKKVPLEVRRGGQGTSFKGPKLSRERGPCLSAERLAENVPCGVARTQSFHCSERPASGINRHTNKKPKTLSARLKEMWQAVPTLPTCAKAANNPAQRGRVAGVTEPR